MVLVPTGAVAKRLGRKFIGIEREQSYIDAANLRIDKIQVAEKSVLGVTTGKRALPRIAFGVLIESGLLQPGTELTDHKQRWKALVRVDGSIQIANEAGSIHKMGAKVQSLNSCNGWTFWHYREGKNLKPIDDLRCQYREYINPSISPSINLSA